MKLPDKWYNFLKWFLIIFTPACITLIETLGIIYKFDTNLIIGTYSAFATFLGAIIGISNLAYNKQYKKDIEEYVGNEKEVK